jgi:multidrug efflux system membrane fusion protein
MKINKKKSIVAALIVVVVILAIVAFFIIRSHTEKKPAPAATPVSAARAIDFDVPVYLEALGTVTPVRTITVQSQVSGVLDSIEFKEGQSVHAGQVIAHIDSRELAAQLLAAQGALARDQAALENARLDLERYQALIKTGSITQQTLDTQAATVKQDAGTVTADEGNVATLKVQIDYTVIRSPVTGIVGLRLVDPGNFVSVGAAPGIAVITQMDPATVVFAVPEDVIGQVHKAMGRGVVPVAAFDRNKAALLASGQLLALDNQVDTTTGTVRVKAVFTGDKGALFPNQFVNARMQVDTLKAVPIVPTRAIQHGSQGDFVFVVAADNKAQLRNIQSGPVDGQNTAVVNGTIKAGEVVVTDGADKLDSGSLVRIVATP